MDPAFLANHIREELNRKKLAQREAERWASLTEEERNKIRNENRKIQKTLHINGICNIAILILGIIFFIYCSMKKIGNFEEINRIAGTLLVGNIILLFLAMDKSYYLFLGFSILFVLYYNNSFLVIIFYSSLEIQNNCKR